MASDAKFSISGDPFSNGGYVATNAEVLTLQLEASPGLDILGVTYSVSTDSFNAPTIVFSDPSPDPPTGAITVPMPASGIHTFLISATIVTSAGIDIKTRAVAILTAAGTRKIAAAETTEFDPEWGWTEAFAQMVDEVDGLGAGGGNTVDWKASATVATDAALPANTYLTGNWTASGNGALTIDGRLMVAGDRVVVKDEGGGTSIANGLAVVTDAGSGGTPWILDRSPDADTDAKVTSGLTVFISEGTANGGGVWVITTADVITLDTTPITFTTTSGTSFVTGPGSTTTNAVPRWDGALGLLNSAVLLDGSDNISGATSIAIGASPALTGALRLERSGVLAWRNEAGDDDIDVMQLDAGDGLTITAVNITNSTAGATIFNASGVLFNSAGVKFGASFSPDFSQNNDTADDATGRLFTTHGQDVTGGGAATIGGEYFTRGGDSTGAATSKTGGAWDARPGAGVTLNGELTLSDAGGTTRFLINSSDEVDVQPNSVFTVRIGGGAYHQFNAAHYFCAAPLLQFTGGAINPVIDHISTTAHDGYSLTLRAQPVTGLGGGSAGQTGGPLNLDAGGSTGLGADNVGGAVNISGAIASGGTVSNIGGPVNIASGIGSGTGAEDGEVTIKRGAANIVETNSSNQTFFGDTVGNETYLDSSGIMYFRTVGSVIMLQLDNVFGFNMLGDGPNFAFSSNALNPKFYQGPDGTTVGHVVGDDLWLQAQNVQGAAAFNHTGGSLLLTGGNALGAGTLINVGGNVSRTGGNATAGATTNTGGNIIDQAGAGATANGFISFRDGGGTERMGVTNAGVAFMGNGLLISAAASTVTLNNANLAFSIVTVAPSIYQLDDPTASGAAGDTLTMHAQDTPGASGTNVAGTFFTRGGDSLGAGGSDVGGDWIARPGRGDTNGSLIIQDADETAQITVTVDNVVIPNLSGLDLSDIDMADHTAKAFWVHETASNDYIVLNTTNGSELIQFGDTSFDIRATFILHGNSASAFSLTEGGANPFVVASSTNLVSVGDATYATAIVTPNSAAQAFRVRDAAGNSCMLWNTTTNALDFNPGALTSFLSTAGVQLSGPLLWKFDLTTDVEIGQAAQSVAVGNLMTIHGHDSAASGGTGGAVIVRAGNTTLTGATTGGALTLHGGEDHSTGTSNQGGPAILRGGNTSGGTANWGGDVQVLVGTGNQLDGNLSLVVNAGSYQSMEGGIFIGNRTTAPTGNPTTGGYLFAQGGALWWRGSSGTETQLAAA